MQKLKVFLLSVCFWSITSIGVQAKEYLIKTTNIEALSNGIEFEIIKTIETANLYLIQTDVEEEKLRKIEDIEIVEKNETIQLPIIRPNQYFYTLNLEEDWGFNYLGFSYLAYGQRDVKIALLDTGVDIDHPILKPYLEEGYTMYPHEGIDDLNGHGTGIAGIIMNQTPTYVRLVPVKVMNQYGRGSSYSIIDGIYQAIESDVDIINLSLGAIYTSKILEQAIQEAIDANIIIVAAAGNYGGKGALYPAKYPHVIGVGSLNEKGEIVHFSQRGEGVDVFVPGENLLTTYNEGNFKTVSGTSFSSGYISKAVAMLKTHQDYTVDEVLMHFQHSLTNQNEITQLSIPKLNYQALLYEEKIQKQLPSVTVADLQKEWTIHFSKSVNMDSVSPRSIYIKGKDEIIKSALKASGNTVTIKPVELLVPGNTYELIVTSYVKSSKGESLKESVLKSFMIENKVKKNP